jgi:hypothetical protein
VETKSQVRTVAGSSEDFDTYNSWSSPGISAEPIVVVVGLLSGAG